MVLNHGIRDRILLPRASVIAQVLLLLALLLMHVAGGHHVGATDPAPLGPGAHAVGSHHAAPAATGHDKGASDPGPAGWCSDDGCSMQTAMLAGLCVVALLGGGILLHLASRRLHPLPGRGLPAPPLWPLVPAPRRALSRAQLSVIRI